MPKDKDLKRVVRARMRKTAESYTTARANTLSRKSSRAVEATPDYAALSGMGDAVVFEKTGRTWADWVTLLDAFGASEKAHRDVARHVSSHGVSGWWSQSVTVGYERIRGLREKGQRLSGSWEASKSRTFGVPLETLYRAFSDGRMRNRWMPGVKWTARKATENKSMRLTWEDGTSVELWFVGKGDSKSQVAVAHTKLASKEDADSRKAWWTERLAVLSTILSK